MYVSFFTFRNNIVKSAFSPKMHLHCSYLAIKYHWQLSRLIWRIDSMLHISLPWRYFGTLGKLNWLKGWSVVSITISTGLAGCTPAYAKDRKRMVVKLLFLPVFSPCCLNFLWCLVESHCLLLKLLHQFDEILKNVTVTVYVYTSMKHSALQLVTVLLHIYIVRGITLSYLLAFYLTLHVTAILFHL